MAEPRIGTKIYYANYAADRSQSANIRVQENHVYSFPYTMQEDIGCPKKVPLEISSFVVIPLGIYYNFRQ